MKTAMCVLAAAAAAAVVPSALLAQGVIPVRQVASFPVGQVGSWSLSQNGQIAYSGFAPDFPVTRLNLATNQSVLLAQRNDTVAGFPTARRLSNFFYYRLNDAGTLLGYGQDDSGTRAVIGGQRFSFTNIARTGDPMPGVPGALFALNTLQPQLFSNASGQFVLSTESFGQAVSYASAPGQPLTVLPLRGSAAPVIGGALDGFFPGAINNNGRIMATGVTQGPGPVTAVYTGTPGNWALRMRTGEAIGPSGLVTSFVSPFSYNNSDGFLADVHFGHASTESLVVSPGPGQPTRIVFQRGASGPGMAPGEVFASPSGTMFTNSFYNNAGHIVTAASIRNSATSTDGVGLWFGTGDDMQLRMRNGAAATGYGGVIIDTFSVTAMNNLDDVVLSVIMSGPGVTSANRFAYYHWSESTGLTPIVRGGDTVLFNGSLRTVSGFWGTAIPGAGQLDVLNDLHQFAFTVQFTDGTNGLMVATVPAPAAAGLLAMVGVAALRRRR